MGVFFGGGGRIGYSGSINEKSKQLSSKGWCSLDSAIEDSEDGDDGKGESLSNCMVVAGVIVSARRRGTKRPFFLG